MTTTQRHTIRLMAAGLIGVAALAACGSDDDAGGDEPAAEETADEPATDEPAAGGAAITISEFSFGDPISVAAGTTVTVTNQDGADHTWTSPDGVFASPTLGQGDSFEFTFDEPGEYAFVCMIHPSMTGSITVT